MAKVERFHRIYWLGSITICVTLILSVVFMVVVSAIDPNSAAATAWELVGLGIVGVLWLGSTGLTVRYWRRWRELRQAERYGRTIVQDDLQVAFNRAFMATARSLAKLLFLVLFILLVLGSQNKLVQGTLHGHPLVVYLILVDGFVILAGLQGMQVLWEQAFQRE